MQLFVISARPQRRGFTLTSEALADPMWYRSAEDAGRYVRWCVRGQGARIETRDERGELVAVEEIPVGSDFSY